jgi:hypothetical protein
MLTKTKCELCGKEVNRQHMKLHQTRKICRKSQAAFAERQKNETADPESQPEPAEPRIALTMTETTLGEEEPQQYCIEIVHGLEEACPVTGCPFKADNSNRMRNHFRNKHVEDTITINQETVPRCPKCGILQKNALTEQHQQSKECMKWAMMYEKRKQYTEQQTKAAEAKFYLDGVELQRVEEFRYLGRMVTNKDNDNKAIKTNIAKARQKWGLIGRFLKREGANPKTMAVFYKAITQSVLLFGSETWVITKDKMRELKSFHHHCARVIARIPIQQKSDGSWFCPPTKNVLEKTGLFSIEKYIRRRRSTVLEYAATTRLLEKCKASKVLVSNPNHIAWWEQDF